MSAYRQVVQFAHTLKSLDKCLEKAAAHAEKKDATAWVENCEQCGSDRVARFDIFYLRRKDSGALAYRVDDGPWQKLVTKLKAGKTYRYQFTQGSNKSTVGTFKTALPATANKTIRFALSGRIAIRSSHRSA